MQTGATPAGTSAPRQRHGDSIDEVWREYRSSPSRPLRERLVVHYIDSHVRPIAERLHASLPRQIEIDDLVQEGYLGLVEAIDRFDVDRDVKFETFSSRRVYGAMQDYLRDIDPVPRVTRTRSKKYRRLADGFEARHGRAPTESDLREHYAIAPDDARRLVAAANPPAMVPFSTARSDVEEDDEGDAMSSFRADVQHNPLTQAGRSDLRRWVTRGFSRRDRLIIILYYFEKMTMKEVGEVIGCCESRVSQRLELILERLRARLAQDASAQVEFE